MAYMQGVPAVAVLGIIVGKGTIYCNKESPIIAQGKEQYLLHFKFSTG